MIGNIEKLQSYVILSPEDISRFRRYIATRYASESKTVHANVLANTIHRVVDRYLSGINPELLPLIKQGLFSHTIANKKESITKIDVFNEIALQDIPIPDACYNISNWINKNENFSIKISDISSIVYSLRRPNIDLESIKINALKEILSENDQFVLPVIFESRKVEASNYLEYSSSTIKGKIRTKNRIIKKQAFAAIITAAAILLVFFSGLSLNSIFLNNSNKVIADSDLSSITSKVISKVTPIIVTPSDIVRQNITKSSAVNSAKKKLKTSKTAALVKKKVKISLKFPYQKIDYDNLKLFLKKSNSILSSNKYLEPILEISEEYGLDPRLLISIAGQEQSLVPKNHPNAKEIANNPFNVFYSWQSYNTNIKDSTRIACRTINRILSSCPKDVDPFTWLNKTYASDKNWEDGVRFFYYQLRKIE